MKRLQAIAVALAYLMLSAGLTWKFGPYALAGAGAVATVSLLVFVDWKEE